MVRLWRRKSAASVGTTAEAERREKQVPPLRFAPVGMTRATAPNRLGRAGSRRAQNAADADSEPAGWPVTEITFGDAEVL